MCLSWRPVILANTHSLITVVPQSSRCCEQQTKKVMTQYGRMEAAVIRQSRGLLLLIGYMIMMSSMCLRHCICAAPLISCCTTLHRCDRSSSWCRGAFGIPQWAQKFSLLYRLTFASYDYRSAPNFEEQCWKKSIYIFINMVVLYGY